MGSLGAQQSSPDTRSLLSKEKEPCPEKVEGGQAGARLLLGQVNAAHVAPGAGCGLSEPLLSASAKCLGLHESQAVLVVATIQEMDGGGDGAGMQIRSAHPSGAQHGNLSSPLLHPPSPIQMSPQL